MQHLRSNRLLAAALSLAGATTLGPYSASATLLYASSYSGTVTTLNLTLPTGAGGANASLEAVSSSRGCAPNPSWLTLDAAAGVLYCTDEGLSTRNGTLSSFRTSKSGVLAQLDKVDTINGPVSAVIYGEGGRGLALAQ